MRKLELHWQILIAILLAAIAGRAVNSAIASGIEDPAFLGISFIGFFDYIGSMFLNALKMIIVPLIRRKPWCAGRQDTSFLRRYDPGGNMHRFATHQFDWAGVCGRRAGRRYAGAGFERRRNRSRG